MAQKAAEIGASLENDSDTDVKKRAVFALTQIPDGNGIPKLIDVAARIAIPRSTNSQCFGWDNHT